MDFKACFKQLNNNRVETDYSFNTCCIDENLFFSYDAHFFRKTPLEDIYVKLEDFIREYHSKKIHLIVDSDLSNKELTLINLIGLQYIDSFDESGLEYYVYFLPKNTLKLDIETVMSHVYENEDVIENLHDAITLYLHEDNLNWTKLGMLVSFIFALVTAFFVILEKENTPGNLILSTMILSVGLILTYIFTEKIKSGIHYMSKHKEKVILLEKIIKFYKPNHVQLLDVIDKKINKNSTTLQLMLIMPQLAYILWPSCFLLSILNYLS